jgi:hypothetical protein
MIPLLLILSVAAVDDDDGDNGDDCNDDEGVGVDSADDDDDDRCNIDRLNQRGNYDDNGAAAAAVVDYEAEYRDLEGYNAPDYGED